MGENVRGKLNNIITPKHLVRSDRGAVQKKQKMKSLGTERSKRNPENTKIETFWYRTIETQSKTQKTNLLVQKQKQHRISKNTKKTNPEYKKINIESRKTQKSNPE